MPSPVKIDPNEFTPDAGVAAPQPKVPAAPSMGLPAGITPFDLLGGPKGLAEAIQRQRSQQGIDQRQATSEAAAERRLKQSEDAAESRLNQSEQFQLNNRRPRYTFGYDKSGNLVQLNEDTGQLRPFPGLTKTPPRAPTMRIVGDTLLAVRFGPDGTPQVTTTKLPISATKNLNEFQQYMGVYTQRHPEDPQMTRLSENYEADRSGARTGAVLEARTDAQKKIDTEKFKAANIDPGFKTFLSVHPGAEASGFDNVYKAYLSQTKMSPTERLTAESVTSVLGQLSALKGMLQNYGPDKWDRTFTKRLKDYAEWRSAGISTGDPKLDQLIDGLITVEAQASAALAHSSGTRAYSFVQHSKGHIPRGFADYNQLMSNIDFLTSSNGPYRSTLRAMGLEAGGLGPITGRPVSGAATSGWIE